MTTEIFRSDNEESKRLREETQSSIGRFFNGSQPHAAVADKEQRKSLIAQWIAHNPVEDKPKSDWHWLMAGFDGDYTTANLTILEHGYVRLCWKRFYQRFVQPTIQDGVDFHCAVLQRLVDRRAVQ
jgi:hypothetical protein